MKTIRPRFSGGEIHFLLRPGEKPGFEPLAAVGS